MKTFKATLKQQIAGKCSLNLLLEKIREIHNSKILFLILYLIFFPIYAPGYVIMAHFRP